MIRNIKLWFKKSSSMQKNALLLAIEGSLGAIILNLTNPFYSMFARRMGAGDYQIGLVSSLPAFLVILTLIPGSLSVDRFNDKKKIVGNYILGTGVMLLAVALTPFAGEYKVMLYILGISILNFPYSMYNISWQAFFSDVFSSGNTNIPYAARTKAATFFGMLSLLAAGIVLAYIPKTDHERIIIYQSFYLIAFVLSILQMKTLMKVGNYKIIKSCKTNSPLGALKSSFKGLAKNKQFSTFIIVVFFFHVSWQMAWPLFFIFQVDYLKANEAWISYLNVAYALASTFTFGFWSRMIDKIGARQVLMLGAIGMALNPILIIMSNSLPVALATYIAVGLLYPAFQLGLFQSLLQVVPQENKTLNIAIYTTSINISGFLSPILGVWIYKMTSIYFAMSLSGIMRFMGAALFYVSYKYMTNQNMEQNANKSSQNSNRN